MNQFRCHANSWFVSFSVFMFLFVGSTAAPLNNALIKALIEFKYESGHGPIIYRDQPLFLDLTDRRAHYIAFDLTCQQSDRKPTTGR